MLSYLHRKVRTTPWLGRTVLRCIPDVKVKISVPPIGKLAIRMRQHRMFWLRSPLVGEGFMLGALRRVTRKGDVVYDIGANIGLYMRMISQVFEAGEVYTFEPMQNNRELIEDNCKLGRCTGVRILPWAVSNEDGTCEFQVDDLTSNSGTLDAVSHGKASQSRAQYGLKPVTVKVETVRLDTIVKERGIPKPDVIKLDVEGAEALALEGAQEVLSKYKPHLVIELHGIDASKGTLPILWRLGYRTFGELEKRKGEPREYQEITANDLKFLTDKYSLHFLVASHDVSLVMQPIEEFTEPAAGGSDKPAYQVSAAR